MHGACSGSPPIITHALLVYLLHSYSFPTENYSTESEVEGEIELYGKYLKQKYKRLRMPLDGQWPPVQASDYVPLILSLSELHKPDSEQILTKKINKILKGDVDRVSNKLINFNDLFKPGEGDEIINSVLVQGSPGIGKTAFSLTLCKKWAAGKLFTQFKIVIFWALRDPHIKSFTSIDDLFFHDSREISEAVVKQVRREGGKGVLFVLDGWDELPAKFTQSRSSGFFLNLIEGKELPFSSVVVTSRSISSQGLFRHGIFNRTIDILGFSKDCINEYIHKCFSKNPEEEKSLLKKLSERPDILSICYVPMNCSIVSYVFSRKQQLPSTLTGFYDLLAKNSLLRNVDLRSELYKNAPDFDHLPNEANSLYLSLCKLSYHGIAVNQYTYSRNDIAAVCKVSDSVTVDVDDLGILQAVNVFHSHGVSSTFHFLHTTLQEFMAANYISSLNREDQEIVIQRHFSNMSFKMVWQFYCGLLDSPSGNKFIKMLQSRLAEAADADSKFHDNFSYCSSDDDSYDSEFDSDNDEQLFDMPGTVKSSTLGPQEDEDISDVPISLCGTDITTTISESFQNPTTLVNELDIDSSPPSTSLSTMPNSEATPSSDVAAPSSTIVTFKNLDDYNLTGHNILITTGGLEGVSTTLSGVSVTRIGEVDSYKDDRVQILFSLKCLYETQCHSLCSHICDSLDSRLFFSDRSLSPNEVNAIGFIIANSKSRCKWHLRMTKCNLSTNHFIMLNHHFLKKGSSGQLTRLYLNGNEMDEICIKELIKMLPFLRFLQKLALSDNKLSDELLKSTNFPEFLRRLHSLTFLDLSRNGITGRGFQQLSLHNHLTHLDISQNDLSFEAAESIANVIAKILTLEYIDIGGNAIGDAGMQILAEVLATNSGLQYIDASQTEITDEGAVLLASGLQSNSTLRTLVLNSNEITHEGLATLLALCAKTKLRKIDFGYCYTGWSDELLTAIHASIPAMETLRALDLSYNDLGDEGINTLISAVLLNNGLSRLALGGNDISSLGLQYISDFICESTTITKISLAEDDLKLTDDNVFEVFCDCMKISSSIKAMNISEVENEEELRKIFKIVNTHRKSNAKNKIKVQYYSSSL